MNKAFLLFILLLSLLHAKDFNLILQKPLDDALLDIKANKDSSITAVGFSTLYSQRNEIQSYTDPYEYLKSSHKKDGTHLYLLNIAKDSSIVNEKYIILNTLSSAHSVVITPSNRFIVVGEAFNDKLVIVKLNKDASLQKKSFFGSKNRNQLSKVVALRDGGVLVVGSSYTSRSHENNIFLSGLGGDDIFLTRFSKDLQQLWSKKIGTAFDDEGIDAIELQNGSFLLLSNKTEDAKTTAILTKLTQNGDTIWQKEIHYNKKDTIAKKLLLLKNREFLVVTEVQKAAHKTPMIQRYSHNANLLQTKLLTLKKPHFTLNDIAEFSNKKLIIVGESQEGDNSDGGVVLLASNLTPLKQRYFGEKNFDSFYAVDILRDATIAIAGLHTATHSQESDIWILKLDSNLKLIQTKPKRVELQKDLSYFLEQSPCSCQRITPKKIRFDLLSDTLYFKQGDYKLQTQQKKQIKKFSKKLMPFLYAHKSQIKYLEINGYTSSEWQTSSLEQRYLKNLSLSSKRAQSVLDYLFKLQDKKGQKLLASLLKKSALSYKDSIKKGKTEDKEHSRRVTLEIVLK